jgi:hypothetical protein
VQNNEYGTKEERLNFNYKGDKRAGERKAASGARAEEDEGCRQNRNLLNTYLIFLI